MAGAKRHFREARKAGHARFRSSYVGFAKAFREAFKVHERMLTRWIEAGEVDDDGFGTLRMTTQVTVFRLWG